MVARQACRQAAALWRCLSSSVVRAVDYHSTASVPVQRPGCNLAAYVLSCVHAGRPNWLHAAPWCPKYDTKNSTQPTIYERLGSDVYARNVLELRRWKALRALEVCQVTIRLPYRPAHC